MPRTHTWTEADNDAMVREYLMWEARRREIDRAYEPMRPARPARRSDGLLSWPRCFVLAAFIIGLAAIWMQK